MNNIRDTLAAEAADAEARADDNPAGMQRATRSSTTSQVYTLRMPAERLAELRAVAEQSGEQPSALMRRWVMERLQGERGHEAELADVRRSLTDALHTLDQIGDTPA